MGGNNSTPSIPTPIPPPTTAPPNAQQKYTTAQNTYYTTRAAYWNAEKALKNKQQGITNYEQVWEQQVQNENKTQWQTILGGRRMYLQSLQQLNQQSLDYQDNLNQEISKLKKKIEAGKQNDDKTKISTVDRSSILHLEEYNKKIKLFKKLKKIIIILFIILILFVVLLQTTGGGNILTSLSLIFIMIIGAIVIVGNMAISGILLVCVSGVLMILGISKLFIKFIKS